MLMIFSCNDNKSHNTKIYSRDFKGNLDSVKLNIHDTTAINTNMLFDSATYIPLETTAQSTFGEISKMEVTNDYFIIFDDQTNAILFFFKNGKFSHKITETKDGVENFKKIGDFSVNELAKRIFIYDSGNPNNRLAIFDLSGNFIAYQNIPASFSEFITSNNKSFFYKRYDQYERVGDNINVFITNSKGVTVDSLFPYNTRIIGREDLYDVNWVFSRSGEIISFFRPFDYSVYLFKGERQWKEIKFILPTDETMPADFLENKEYTGRRRKFIGQEGNKGKIWAISSFHVLSDNIIYIQLSFEKEGTQDYLYNQKTGKTYNFSNLSSGTLTNLMPVLQDKIYASDGYNLYGAISSKLIITAVLQLGVDKIENNTALANFFKTASIKSNPVIIKLKPKKHF